MNSIDFYSETENDKKKILYEYHLLALQNGWGLGLKHMEFGIIGDDIAPRYAKSGSIPFYNIYGFHKPCPSFNIIHTGSETICNIQGWSEPKVIFNTILAKTIVDYIFTYWNNYHINLAITLAKSGINKLMSG